MQRGKVVLHPDPPDLAAHLSRGEVAAVSNLCAASPYHFSAGDDVRAQAPLFSVVLKDGEYWRVEAEWPDGTIEEVRQFKRGSEALNWVKAKSEAWVSQRMGIIR